MKIIKSTFSTFIKCWGKLNKPIVMEQNILEYLTITHRYDTSLQCFVDGHCGLILLKKKVLGWFAGLSNHNKKQIYDISLGFSCVDTGIHIRVHIHTRAKQTMLSQSVKSMHTFVSSRVLYRGSMRRCGQADMIAEWCMTPPAKPLGPSTAENPNATCSWPPWRPTVLLGTFLCDLLGLYTPNVVEKIPWTGPKVF